MQKSQYVILNKFKYSIKFIKSFTLTVKVYSSAIFCAMNFVRIKTFTIFVFVYILIKNKKTVNKSFYYEANNAFWF